MNIRVRARLHRLQRELSAVLTHVRQYQGVPEKDRLAIDSIASDIAESAARLAAEARRAYGNESHKTLVRDVRKALGYYSP